MSTFLKVGVMGLALGITLMGCHDDSSAPPTSPPSPSMTSFEGYSFSLVEESTCDDTAPADINVIDFAFNQDQDTATPRDVTTVTSACTS
jgi:hypothetical protein